MPTSYRWLSSSAIARATRAASTSHPLPPPTGSKAATGSKADDALVAWVFGPDDRGDPKPVHVTRSMQREEARLYGAAALERHKGLGARVQAST